MLFGGRRATVVPLVSEARSWEHGVFLGATMSVETTAAAAGEVGALRFDPMAMLPFCGYNMGDYFSHWLDMGSKADESKLPKIFLVNWFRKDADGNFIWPGFGDNIRVLDWVMKRCDGNGGAEESVIGLVPPVEEIDTSGADVTPEQMQELLTVNPLDVSAQLAQVSEHLASFGDRLPAGIRAQLDELERRTGDA
jgi:phosphoenolpyruvate carboxykinase (GTP)